jgi:hypothetical protein
LVGRIAFYRDVLGNRNWAGGFHRLHHNAIHSETSDGFIWFSANGASPWDTRCCRTMQALRLRAAHEK